MALLHQKCRKGVTRRMHPRPRLGVGKIVVKLDRMPQMGVGFFMPALTRPDCLLRVVEPYWVSIRTQTKIYFGLPSASFVRAERDVLAP